MTKPVQTHYDHCWLTVGHHECAKAEIVRLENLVGEYALDHAQDHDRLTAQRDRAIEIARWWIDACRNNYPTTTTEDTAELDAMKD